MPDDLMEKITENTSISAQEEDMRKFDPWQVFFKSEWNRNWPFIVGFAVTGAIIVKFTAGLTEEDAKKSRFVQEHNRRMDLAHRVLANSDGKGISRRKRGRRQKNLRGE